LVVDQGLADHGQPRIQGQQISPVEPPELTPRDTSRDCASTLGFLGKA
jgi:hypothetical protein